MVVARDLNSNGSLSEGRVLPWIEEEAFVFGARQLKNGLVVTRYTSNIKFLSVVPIRNIIEIGIEAIGMSRPSITSKCIVRKKSNDTILSQIEEIVFVLIDRKGPPKPIIKHWMHCKRLAKLAF